MFCGLCSQVCPVDAITMSHEYELSVLDRDGLIYTKTELAAIGGAAARTGGTPAAIPRPTDAWAGTRDGKYDRFRDKALMLR